VAEPNTVSNMSWITSLVVCVRFDMVDHDKVTRDFLLQYICTLDFSFESDVLLILGLLWRGLLLLCSDSHP
jgi:hypothetical protein